MSAAIRPAPLSARITREQRACFERRLAEGPIAFTAVRRHHALPFFGNAWVCLEATHLRTRMRGVRENDASTRTATRHGVRENDACLRREFPGPCARG